MNLVEKARAYAYDKHKDQLLSDGMPYSVHLENVVVNLHRFVSKPSDNLVIACLLHDTVEDTDTTLEEIEALFGPTVKDIVYRVSDEEGKNRKERKIKTYPKIKGHFEATIVKLCDRIANAEYPSNDKQKDYKEMYRKEQPLFEQLSYYKDTCPKWIIVDTMWEYLRNTLKKESI